MRQLNLFLACFWLMIGLGLLFFIERLPGEAPRVPLGIFALAMAAYNLLRWGLIQMQGRLRREQLPPPVRPRVVDTTFTTDEPAPRPHRDEPPETGIKKAE